MANALAWINVPISVPVGWWKFNDGSGTNAADSSGNGFDGTTHGTPTPSWGSGILNLVAANVQDVTVPFNSTLQRGVPLSLSMWFSTSTVADCVLIDSGFITTNDGWAVEYRPTAGGIITVHFKFNILNVQYQTIGTLSFDGTWHNVICTVDTTSKVLTYLDGVVDATNATGKGDMVYGNRTLFMGSRNGGGYLTGSIDDFRIYNVCLDATSVTAIFNAGRS